MPPRQFSQARRYSRLGVGFGGALLKHSLYPLRYLGHLLEGADTVLDLGCGEGMLTNLLAEVHPEIRFTGWDLDEKKIALARRAAGPGVRFECGDFRQIQDRAVSAIILNDVLHHYPLEDQLQILHWTREVLAGDGLLILKEVDAVDRSDVAWTSFWDHRLYPEDRLQFRTIPDWKDALSQAGFRFHDLRKVAHPWPASRTVLVATPAPKVQAAAREIRSWPTTAIPARVLVTGGSGFIGEHLLRTLLADGLNGQPVAIDVLVRTPANFPPDLREIPHLRIFQADLSDGETLKEVPTSYDTVFHLAADVDFFASAAIIRNNLEGTRNLLKHLSPGPLKRFVYTSTMGAVDRAPGDPLDELLHEESSAHPVSAYGRSKLEGEREVAHSGHAYTILRVPWCYGPGMSKTHHVRVLLEKAARRHPLLRFDWPGRVSLIAVADLVRLLIETATSPGPVNQLFFVADGEPISFGDLFREMGATFGLRAGSTALPGPLKAILKTFRRFLPFQLRCLVGDVLAVSTAKLVTAGHEPATREDGFLVPLGRYVSQQRFPLRHHQDALITGAASGIGAALARQAYARGYHLWLVDRNREVLQAIAAKLSATPVAGDLADPRFLETLSQMIAEAKRPPRLLINNAGIGRRNSFASNPYADQRLMVEVNVLALVQLTHACLRAVDEGGALTICEISSSAALQPLAGMSVYAATKAFVLSFSEGLAAEVSDRPAIEIITILPSGTRTSFQQEAGVKNTTPAGLLDPADVAGEILRSVGRGSHTRIIGRSGQMMNIAARILPRRYQAALWKRLMDRMR